MANSLVKFHSRTQGGERGQLYWGRADLDGLPFRGPAPPDFTREEFEERVAKVGDPHNGRFRTWIEEENKAYLDVVDMVVNGWAQCLFIDRWRDPEEGRHVIYVEWAEYFLEDGNTRAQVHGGHLSYGQPNLAQHFAPH
jgi:hypothetical protein